jgi:hypothetical protein
MPLRWPSHRSGIRQPNTYVKPEVAVTVLELLMMGVVSHETCWAIKKHWNNKFYYTVASCWFFLWDLCVRCTDPWTASTRISTHIPKNVIQWIKIALHNRQLVSQPVNLNQQIVNNLKKKKDISLRNFRFSQRHCLRSRSSEMWRRLFGWIFRDVSKDRVALIFGTK